MPKDNREYITVALDMPGNPKYAHLTDTVKFKLIRAWIYCAQHRTDGFIPMSEWKHMASISQRYALHMTDGITVLEDGSGVRFDDYLEHQLSKSDRDAMEERARSGAEKSAEVRRGNSRAKVVAEAERILTEAPLIRLAEEEEEINTPKESPSDSPKGVIRSKAEQIDELFQTWWMCYPKKVGRAEARKAFAKALNKIEFEQLQLATAKFATDPNLPNGNEIVYIPNGSTWLNQERWNDPPLPPRFNSNQKPNNTEVALSIAEMGRRVLERNQTTQTALAIGR